MHSVRRLAPLLLGVALACACATLAGLAAPPGPYQLPLAQATEWQVCVFAARVPEPLRSKPLAFTAKATWQAGGAAGAKELQGNATWLKTVRLPLSVPAGCSALSVVLDWSADAVDLDLGLECPALGLHVAPVLTVLKPEKARLDAQTAPFFQWLSSQHPEWWKGYPFWADVGPAPKAAAEGPPA
jgi:hypothetical protein